MELRHLRVFMTLAEELHFGKASARLRIAQSAVSQTLKDLEAEVGAVLFERTRRSVEITAAGASFRQHAALALLELERATAAASKAARGETGSLTLRFTLMSALTALPRAVAHFQAAYPEVALQIEPGGTTEQLDAIMTGRCDVGFVSKKGDISPLASELIEKAPLVALVPSHSPLAKLKRLELSALAGSKMVFLRQASEPDVRMKFRARCLESGFEPNIIVEVEQLEVLLAFVAAGVGVSCVPGLVSRIPFPGVTIVPFTSGVEGGISMVWNPGRLSPTAERFLAVMRKERDAGKPARVPRRRSSR
jgi:DNA-binding transcriptional LysR family regulator